MHHFSWQKLIFTVISYLLLQVIYMSYRKMHWSEGSGSLKDSRFFQVAHEISWQLATRWPRSSSWQIFHHQDQETEPSTCPSQARHARIHVVQRTILAETHCVTHHAGFYTSTQIHTEFTTTWTYPKKSFDSVSLEWGSFEFSQIQWTSTMVASPKSWHCHY